MVQRNLPPHLPFWVFRPMAGLGGGISRSTQCISSFSANSWCRSALFHCWAIVKVWERCEREQFLLDWGPDFFQLFLAGNPGIPTYKEVKQTKLEVNSTGPCAGVWLISPPFHLETCPENSHKASTCKNRVTDYWCCKHLKAFQICYF